MVFNFRTYSSSSESVQDDPTPPRSFSLAEIGAATDNFSHDNFLAEWENRVAVKRACCVQRGEEQFEAEMQVGSTVSRHPNVLYLRGFYRTEKELLLVDPLMINDSLSYNLRESPDRFARPLDWTTRKQIALAAARELAHLHNQGNTKITRYDISAPNILLKFSFAMIMHERNMERGIIERSSYQLTDHPSVSESYHHFDYANAEAEMCGRRGFIAPEYILTRKCTLKIDVYAYGMMLFELITGMSIVEILRLLVDDHPHCSGLTDSLMTKLGSILDPNLQGNYVEQEAQRLFKLAMLCSNPNPSIRPEMSEVVRLLESQFHQRDTSTRSSWSQRARDLTLNYSFFNNKKTKKSALLFAG